MAALEEGAGEAGLRLKRQDRKSEKAALQSERQALERQLQLAEDAAAELSLSVPLLVQRVRSKYTCQGCCHWAVYMCGSALTWSCSCKQSVGSWRQASAPHVHVCLLPLLVIWTPGVYNTVWVSESVVISSEEANAKIQVVELRPRLRRFMVVP